MTQNIDFMKAGLQGAIIAGYHYWANPATDILIGGGASPVNLPLFAGAAGALASGVGDMVQSYVLPQIPKEGKFGRMESAVLSPLINAASYIGSYYALNGANSINRLGAIRLASEAVGSDLAAHYVKNNIL